MRCNRIQPPLSLHGDLVSLVFLALVLATTFLF